MGLGWSRRGDDGEKVTVQETASRPLLFSAPTPAFFACRVGGAPGSGPRSLTPGLSQAISTPSVPYKKRRFDRDVVLLLATVRGSGNKEEAGLSNPDNLERERPPESVHHHTTLASCARRPSP